jgi:hypothetical protein
MQFSLKSTCAYTATDTKWCTGAMHMRHLGKVIIGLVYGTFTQILHLKPVRRVIVLILPLQVCSYYSVISSAWPCKVH